jgi:pilus assembly protein Flp/PilA
MKTRIVKLYTDAKLAMDDRGASAVEYGLLVAGIAAVIVAAVFLLGGNVNDTLSDVASSIEQ